MTKNEMINFIETSKAVINFDRKYFERLTKSSVKRIYDVAVAYKTNKDVK